MKYLLYIFLPIAFFQYFTFSVNSFTVYRGILKSGEIKQCNISQIDDGDTFDLDCSDMYIPNVRLFGVNAPDYDSINKYKHCFYDESKNILSILNNRSLSVEFMGSDQCKDSYKGCRNLVIIYDVEKNIDINEQLVSKGFSFSWTNFSSISNSYRLKLLKAENYAATNKLGLWNECEIIENTNLSINSSIPTKMTK